MSSQSPYQAPEGPQWQNQPSVSTSPDSRQYPSSQPSTGFPQSPGYAAQPPYPPMPSQLVVIPVPQYVVYPGTAAVSQPKNGLAIAGLVFGIIGVFSSWILVGIPFCIVGLVLALVGMRRSEGKGMAIAGLVLSIIGIVVALGVIVAVIVSSPSSK